MDLTYSLEQTALKAAAGKLLRERYTAEHRAVPGSFREVMAAQGWLSMTVPDAMGGLGLGMIEACLVAEEMGQHLSREAFTTHVYAASLLTGLKDAGAHQDQLTGLMDGRISLAVVDQAVPLAGVRAEGRIMLSGTATALDANGPTAVLGTAWIEGVTHLVRLDLTTDVQRFQTVDGRTAAKLDLGALVALDIGPLKDDAAAIAFDSAVALQVADMSGAMQAALDQTVVYAKTRVQFGQPIGANQVVKHRLVEMAVRCEEARSLALLAAIRTSDGSTKAVRARAVSGAKAKVAKMARAVMEDAVQLHGGMGVTDELEIGWYLKRALAFDAMFGTPRFHRQRYAAMAV